MTGHTPWSEIKHKKDAGTFLLECGHRQVISDWRFTMAAEGQEQHAVWCMICDDWREPTVED